jgi:hypothetical protein
MLLREPMKITVVIPTYSFLISLAYASHLHHFLKHLYICVKTRNRNYDKESDKNKVTRIQIEKGIMPAAVTYL